MQGGLPLSSKDRDQISRYLSSIQNTNRDICHGMIIALEHAQSSREISELITNSIVGLIQKTQLADAAREVKQIYAHLFLISDILFNAQCP